MPKIYNYELCPVCNKPLHEGFSPYCSDKCSIAAYNYRKRIAPVEIFLGLFGFTFEYQSQVYLETTLPDYVAMHYPQNLRRFSFPDPGSDFSTLNADDYWQAIEHQLGQWVKMFLLFLYRGGVQGDDFGFTSALMMFVQLVQHEKSFKCDECHRHYIVSAAAKPEHGYLCSHCETVTQPF